MQIFSNVSIQPSAIMVRFDLKSIFTQIPVGEALNIVEEKLVNNDPLENRTTLDPEIIIDLIKFCMSSTYFTFDNDIPVT